MNRTDVATKVDWVNKVLLFTKELVAPPYEYPLPIAIHSR